MGRLDAWRGFDLAIEAFAKVHEQEAMTYLTIVGEGSDRIRLERLIVAKGLTDSVRLIGKVTMDEYKKLMTDADVVVNASLKEGGVTVAFDAMSMGKPIVCVDSGGYTRYFNEDYAVVVDLTGRKEVIDELAKGMLKLTVPATREAFGSKAKDASELWSWERHGLEIRDVITECYENWIRSNKNKQ